MIPTALFSSLANSRPASLIVALLRSLNEWVGGTLFKSKSPLLGDESFLRLPLLDEHSLKLDGADMQFTEAEGLWDCGEVV